MKLASTFYFLLFASFALAQTIQWTTIAESRSRGGQITFDEQGDIYQARTSYDGNSFAVYSSGGELRFDYNLCNGCDMEYISYGYPISEDSIIYIVGSNEVYFSSIFGTQKEHLGSIDRISKRGKVFFRENNLILVGSRLDSENYTLVRSRINLSNFEINNEYSTVESHVLFMNYNSHNNTTVEVFEGIEDSIAGRITVYDKDYNELFSIATNSDERVIDAYFTDNNNLITVGTEDIPWVNKGICRAYDSQGVLLWEFKLASSNLGIFLTQIAQKGDKLIIAGIEGLLHLNSFLVYSIDENTGERIWELKDKLSPTDGHPPSDIHILDDGNIIVSGTELSDFTGPERAYLFKIIDDDATSISDIKESNFSIYPNPASHQINIKGLSNFKRVEIINSAGEIVAVSSYLPNIDVSHLSSGNYILKVYTNETALTKKFIIEHP